MKQDKETGGTRQPGKTEAQAGAKPEGRKRLGDNLRKMYDEVVNEPVPQEMLDLLSRLKDEKR